MLCAALLSVGSVVPAHAQLANSEPVIVAAAAAKTTKETEEALGLTRSQRVWVQKGLNALNFDVGTAVCGVPFLKWIRTGTGFGSGCPNGLPADMPTGWD